MVGGISHSSCVQTSPIWGVIFNFYSGTAQISIKSFIVIAYPRVVCVYSLHYPVSRTTIVVFQNYPCYIDWVLVQNRLTKTHGIIKAAYFVKAAYRIMFVNDRVIAAIF